MSEWERVARLRGRRLVGRYGGSLVVGLLVVAVLTAAGAGLLFASPPTIDSTEDRATTLVAVDTGTSAVVTEETTLYEEGTRLEDRAVYLRTATPTLTVSTTATPTGAATVEQGLSLVYRAERGDDVVWSETVPLAVERTTTGGSTTVRATIDVRAVDRRLQAIRSEVGGAAAVRVSLQHDLTYRTETREVDRTRTAPLTITQDSHWLSTGVGGPVQVTETVQTSRPDPGATDVVTLVGQEAIVPTRAVWLLGIGFLALLGAVLAERERRRNPDPRAIDRELERLQFSEWISTGRVDVGDAETYAVVDTLGDLVDVAIDSNRRVVHDREAGRYVVAVDASVYTFSRDGNEMQRSSEELAGTGGADTADHREEADSSDAGVNDRDHSESVDRPAEEPTDPVEQFLETEFDADPDASDDADNSTQEGDDGSFVFRESDD